MELGGYPPKDVTASYKLFKLIVRVDSNTIPVASIREDTTVTCLHDDIPSELVKDALSQFTSNMDSGYAMDPIRLLIFSQAGGTGF